MIQNVRVALSQAHLAVYPGGPALPIVVSVENGTSNVDEFRLRIDGLDPGWTRLEDATIRLFPGDQAHTILAIQVPATALAGLYVFRVVATSSRDSSLVTAVEARIEVPVIGRIDLVPIPERLRGRRSANGRLRLRNGRNAHTQVNLQATDGNGVLAFVLRPSDLVLEPGSEVETEVRAVLPRPRLTGPERWHLFNVSVLDVDNPLEPPLTGVSVQVVQLPLVGWLAGWLRGLRRWATVGLLLVVLGGVAAWSIGAPGERQVDEVAPPQPALAAAESGQNGRAGALGVAAAAQSADPEAARKQVQAATGTDSMTAGLRGGGRGPDARPSPTAAPATIARFGLVPPGEQSPAGLPLQWDVRSADTIRVEQNPSASDGRYDTLEQRGYTLTAANQAGEQTQSLTIYVVRPPTIETFTANHEQIVAGESVYLAWQTVRADGVFLDDVKVDSPSSGALTVQPTETHTFVLRAENAAGSVEQTLMVEVKPPPTPTPAPTATPAPTVRPTPRPLP